MNASASYPNPCAPWATTASYDGLQLGRLSFVRRARDLGFSLDQVRELLDLADQRDRSCEAVDVIARQHLDEVERRDRRSDRPARRTFQRAWTLPARHGRGLPHHRDPCTACGLGDCPPRFGARAFAERALERLSLGGSGGDQHPGG